MITCWDSISYDLLGRKVHTAEDMRGTKAQTAGEEMLIYKQNKL